MVDRAATGGAWQPPKAADWNAIAEAAEAYHQQRAGTVPGFVPRSIDTDVVRVKNSSGANRRAGDILQVSSSLLTAVDPLNLWFDGVAPVAPLWTAVHGVLRRAVASTDYGELQVSGVVRAYVNITNTNHKRCDVAASTYVLQSAHAGPYQILYQPASTGEQVCVVLLGPKRPSNGIAKLGGGLAAGSTGSTTSANATLQKRNTGTGALESANQTITVRSWFATAFATNDYLSVAQDESGDWWLETADCP